MDDLEDFLKGNEQPVEAVEPVEAPEPTTEAASVAPEAETAEAKAERIRDEKGRFAPKGEEAAPPADTEQHSIPPKALQEERRKRQELEARLAEYEARFSRQPQQPAPDIWEDTQGWQQNLQQEVVGTAVQAATMNARLDMSEMMVRQSQPDFEDKKAAFLDLMRETPGLQQKALADPHPWQFAYNYVANHQRMQELSATNVAELEAKLREQIRAELQAKPAPVTPPVPETLADAQSARGSSAPLTVPTLDQILGRSS